MDKVRLWAGRIMSALVILFLAVDSVGKLLRLDPVVQATTRLGYPSHVVFGIGLVLAISVVLHLVPRTSVLGAVLLTGFLGGATATHVRVDDPMFSHTLFPIYVAAFLWGGLFLRDTRVRSFFPLRTER
ncbi:MAG: DoxX family protein [Myxococcaceae bacterium]|nr:DoxX family protein [Myxococcaceae bacterium]